MKPYILVVDDWPDTLDLVVHILCVNGFDVELASSGPEALQKFEAALGSERPFELVLTDVSMPEMDGLELCHRIKAQKPDCPVLLFTASADIPTRVLGRYEGADAVLDKPSWDKPSWDGVVQKPVAMTELLSTIKEQLLGPRDGS